MPIARVLRPDGEPLTSFRVEALSPDGDELALQVSGRDRGYLTYDAATGGLEPTLVGVEQSGNVAFINQIALSSGGRVAFQTSYDLPDRDDAQAIVVLSEDGEEAAVIAAPPGLSYSSPTFVGEDRIAYDVSQARDSSTPLPPYDVEIRDIDTGGVETIDVGAPGNSRVSLLDTSADGGLLLFGRDFDAETRRPYLYDTDTGELSVVPGGLSGAIGSGQLVPRDPSIFGNALLDGERSYVVLDAATGEALFEAPAEGFRVPVVSADGRFLAVTENFSALTVFDRAEGTETTIALDPLFPNDDVSVLRAEALVEVDGAPVVTLRGELNGVDALLRVDPDVIAAPDEASTTAGTPVTIDVLADDVDFGDEGLTLVSAEGAINGSVAVEDGEVVYTPNTGFAGEERFVYTVRDGGGAEDQGEVLVLVSGPPRGEPLVVTTADGAIDPDDGELSLREAVAAANLTEGADTILFAEGINEIELSVEGGGLEVTDDLVIDGDLGDGGAEAVRLVWQTPAGQFESDELPDAAFAVDGVGLRLEDLTLTSEDASGFGYGPIRGVSARDADLAIVRSAIVDLGSYTEAAGVVAEGGTLLITGSEMREFNFGGFGGGTAVRTVGVSTRIEGSEFRGGAYLMELDGNTDIERSAFYGVSGVETGTFVIEVSGDTRIDGSTVVSAYGYQTYGSVGVSTSGRLELTNSTIVGPASGPRPTSDVALEVRDGGYARVVNSTLAGTLSDYSFDAGGRSGVVVEEGGSAYVANSILAGNYTGEGPGGGRRVDISGDFVSGGGNVFGQAEVEGAAPDDILGADPAAVFAELEEVRVFRDETVLFPVLADNGGPTPTIALLDDPRNPAIGLADPGSAPATDQRGFARDAQPDAGAFELGAEGGVSPPPPPPPPPPPGEGGSVALAFVSAEAEYANTVGYYTVEDGATGFGVLFDDVSEAEAGDVATVEGVDPVQTGFFLIRDGADLGLDFEGAEFAFDGRGGLLVTEADGTETRLKDYQVQFDFEEGQLQVDVLGDDTFRLNWEDKGASEGSYDGDFDDAVFVLERMPADDMAA